MTNQFNTPATDFPRRYTNPLARWTLPAVGWGLLGLTAGYLLVAYGGSRASQPTCEISAVTGKEWCDASPTEDLAVLLGFTAFALAVAALWFTYSFARHLGWTPVGAGVATAAATIALPLTTIIAVALWVKRNADARRAAVAQAQIDAQFQTQQMQSWQHESADAHAANQAAAVQGSAGGGDPGTRFRSK